MKKYFTYSITSVYLIICFVSYNNRSIVPKISEGAIKNYCKFHNYIFNMLEFIYFFKFML